MKTLTFINCESTPELRSILDQIIDQTNQFINADNSPLGDLSAELNLVAYYFSEPKEIGNLVLTFDISNCIYTDFEDIELAADEACNSQGNSVMTNLICSAFDINKSLVKFNYKVTYTTLIFTAEIHL